MKVELTKVDIAIASTLIFVGAGMLAVAFRLPLRSSNPSESFTTLALLISGPTLFGVGVGWRFRHPVIGGVVGLLAIAAFFFTFVFGNC